MPERLLLGPGVGRHCLALLSVSFSKLHLIFRITWGPGCWKGEDNENYSQAGSDLMKPTPSPCGESPQRGGGSGWWVQSFLPPALPSSFLVSPAIDIKIEGLAQSAW